MKLIIKHFLCRHARASGYELVQYEAQQGVRCCAVIIRDSVSRANGAACPQHPNLAHTQTITVPCWAPSESDPRLSPLWHSSAAMVFVRSQGYLQPAVPSCQAASHAANVHPDTPIGEAARLHHVQLPPHGILQTLMNGAGLLLCHQSAMHRFIV